MSEAALLRTAALVALGRLDWRQSAILFLQAAEAVPPNPHRLVTAEEQGLRRDAYLALNRTQEFYDYRERMRKAKDKSIHGEWHGPSTELVTRLLCARRKVA